MKDLLNLLMKAEKLIEETQMADYKVNHSAGNEVKFNTRELTKR